ncbi:MAG: hypothetical protein GY928_01115 [Colwellia sp.]|nr:hypothetical protein [Colwellia sp.]
MIGRHYDLKNYNCAHFVADWYRTKMNIEIPIIDEFDISFLRWMRQHFTSINKPEENSVVYMVSNSGTHIGVFADNGVYHNYQTGKAKGAVVHWDLGVIIRNYNKVSFWKWSQ